MNIKQQITISGRNWNDIIQLPCFMALHKKTDGTFAVELDPSTSTVQQQLVKLIDGKNTPRDEFKAILRDNLAYGEAFQGDTLVEYDDATWKVIHSPQNSDKVKHYFSSEQASFLGLIAK